MPIPIPAPPVYRGEALLLGEGSRDVVFLPASLVCLPACLPAFPLCCFRKLVMGVCVLVSLHFNGALLS